MSKPTLDPFLDEELAEILDARPATWLRRSTFLLLGILALAIAVAGRVRYPDTLRARVTIVSSEPPIPIVARRSGRLVEVRVQEGMAVHAGDVLGVLDHDGVTEDLLSLGPLLDAVRERLGSEEALAATPQLPARSLGELGPIYASLSTSLEELRALHSSRAQQTRWRASTSLVRDGGALVAQLLREREVAREGLALSEERHRRAQALVREGLGSAIDLDEARAGLVRARTELEELTTRVVTARATEGDALLRLATLEHETWLRHRDLVRSIAEAHQRLDAGLREWQRTVLLRAPIDGHVALQEVWSAGQFVRESQDVFEVLPHEALPIGRAAAPQQNLGRLATGQPVRIVLDAYPIERFGILRGRVADIAPSTGKATSSMEGESPRYLLHIELPSRLRTTHGMELQFRQGMTGDADILVEDISLLARLFYPLRGMWLRTTDAP